LQITGLVLQQRVPEAQSPLLRALAGQTNVPPPIWLKSRILDLHSSVGPFRGCITSAAMTRSGVAVAIVPMAPVGLS